MLKNQRAYDRKSTVEQRAYDRKLVAGDRKFARKKLVNDRRYAGQQVKLDRHEYSADRNLMQNRANNLAEKSAASRGIDFQRMRDDAVAAGYNPMTALSMAHAYSTNVDYSLQGGVYSPRSSYTAQNNGTTVLSGGGGGGGGGGAQMAPSGSMPMASQIPAAGGFGVSGAGYQSQFNPALSSGGFIQEAMDRASTLYNEQVPQKDNLAEALRGAMQHSQMVEQVRDAQVPGDFGYSLSKVEPFQPSQAVGVPLSVRISQRRLSRSAVKVSVCLNSQNILTLCILTALKGKSTVISPTASELKPAIP